MHGFWIMDDTSVVVETIDSESTAENPADIALYQRVMDELWTVAVEGDDARAMVARLATETAASR
ncbi:MAG: family transcriptional regulator [Amycolatopsis sp.]|nr:family transcriptional regulator [Amycolatopsis sp.]